MNLVHTVINDLSEIDYDDLYERARDGLDASWPESSPWTDAERKENLLALIQSGLNNEWPGLNPHGPNDRYIVVKVVDEDTGKLMGLGTGFLLEGGIFDGRHSLSAADENGSRNYIYSPANQQARRDHRASLGITHMQLRNIPNQSIHHLMLRMRAANETYEIVEDIETPGMPMFRNLLLRYL